MGLTYLDYDADTLATIVTAWSPASATTEIFKKFIAAVKKTKKYMANVDEEQIGLILESVKPELLAVLKKVPAQPKALKIYTDGALFSSKHSLFIEYTPPTSKKAVKKKLEVDWSSLKGALKEEGAFMDEVVASSERENEAEEKLRRKNAPTQWVVLEHPDIGPLIEAKIGKEAAETLNLGPVPVSVTITDKQILVHLASAKDMPNVIQKVIDAADWDAVVDTVAEACRDGAEIINDDPANYKSAQDLIGEALEEALQEATDRALRQTDHFRQIKKDYKKYKVVAAVKVSVSVVGILAGVAGLALSPFTFGASTVLGCIALWRSAIQLGDQIGKLSMEAEQTGGFIAEQVITMLDAYEDKAKTVVGLGEVAKEMAKILMPTDLIPTIKGVRNMLGVFHDKTNGLEIRSNKVSQILSQTTDAELAATRAFQQFLDENSDALTPKEKKKVGEIMDQIPLLRQQTDQLIREVRHLNSRVQHCRDFHETLSAVYEALSAKNPTWAVVVNELIPIATDIGLIAGGGIGGAMESLGAVGEAGKTAADSIGLILTIGNDLNDIVDDTTLEIKNRAA